MPKYSVVVPVFKREDEVRELLFSLSQQQFKDFEIIIVDGSPTDALEVISDYVAVELSHLQYMRIYSKGLGISDSRNLGAKYSKGEFLIFMDSDVIVPDDYFQILESELSKRTLDGFGGPDAAHESFSIIQKAISYSMTSVLTTGGIRGKKSHVGKFKPRGFNMGIRKSVFNELKGFNAALPVGEDMDLSARLIAAGHATDLIPDAKVYHKRRVSIRKFYNQVYRFGAARVMLSQMHKGEMKITHLFPLAFSLYLLLGFALPSLSMPLFYAWAYTVLFYFAALFGGAMAESKSVAVAFYSIPVTITQFFGYAMGFVRNGFAVWVQGKPSGIFQKKEGEPESPL
jgi:glycosyltransferase involved in cell wall biosynthesis